MGGDEEAAAGHSTKGKGERERERGKERESKRPT